jgi:hypothetical protein
MTWFASRWPRMEALVLREAVHPLYYPLRVGIPFREHQRRVVRGGFHDLGKNYEKNFVRLRRYLFLLCLESYRLESPRRGQRTKR